MIGQGLAGGWYCGADQPESSRVARGGYTNVFEIICCDCGDQLDLDYREVSPELQRITRAIPDRCWHCRR